MKLYDYGPAPSPRRVRIYLAEKGIGVPTVPIDLKTHEQWSDRFVAINDRCDVPFLVLDDGTGIGEVVAICRYFEALHPDPPLFGVTPLEQAQVAMWNHRFEVDGFQATAEGLRNGHPAFDDNALVGPDRYARIEELAVRGRTRTVRFLAWLDELFGERRYVIGDTFTFADITAMVCVEFARWIKISPEEGQANLRRWYHEVSARPSARA